MSNPESSSRLMAERLAELADWASRLGRKEQADRFLIMAWLAYDAEDKPDAPLRSAA